ncbi:8-demethyl-8-aminoriboflavin-5'-phosphate phosphatase [Streptomyces camelliae]|uniref:8-demethyl-8-aminoriboflavin-5'-phosphate phosphatase n=1 Tax=Streptomyces camelliae TaxID=3004093 RepID=A0ABY7PGA5_9ACTN|nr:8-demethyl-8-aminoriboflavin-5'-phosphate phosphatase [Streptomyces sp. HUAS 2-6]WBO69646.1 8-demethyl-8-aminoriboflavin-5'-phosphate phosphatase [Streptomyces sp. HUAS 2-6]
MSDGREGFLNVMRSVYERYLVGVPGVTEVWLIRHADSYTGLEDYRGDPRDPSLSHKGRVQAGLLAARLADVPLEGVWASGARRAQETAKAVAAGHGLSVVTDPRLREVRTNWDDGRPSELKPHGVYPFPEPEKEVAERMREAVAAAVAATPAADGATPSRVAVVGHDSALVILLGSLLNLGWGQLDMLLPLTSVSVVAVKGERMVVRSIGDATHLVSAPPDMP